MAGETEGADIARLVGERMAEVLLDIPALTQKHAVRIILTEFEGACLHRNARNHLAIDRRALRVFEEITGDKVVWEKGKRRWRHRRASDGPGRLQR
jgi:hypothetical protein